MIKINSEIKLVNSREILDSRGNPTLETTVVLDSGARGTASVPSGASTGIHEATELRDGESRFFGKGVLKAVSYVNGRISSSLLGVSALDQIRADSIMIALDGTENKSNLGANAILSVSLAVARAAASHIGIPLYRYLGGSLKNSLPIPMMNIINGGAHADNMLDIQEFMIIPKGAESFKEAVRMGAEVYSSLKKLIHSKKLNASVGDEGGFAPLLKNPDEALDLICEATQKTGLKLGSDIFFGLDVASSEWFLNGAYELPKENKRITRTELSCELMRLCDKYPIMSIEDGMAEDDIDGWRDLTKKANDKIMLVGDDLFVTNKERLSMGISEGIANAVLIKPNQIGTVSEVTETVALAKSQGYKTVMSHRSGETSDSFIADLAVALECEFIKAGAPARSERTEKYNRLMKIENELFAPNYFGRSI